MKTLWISILFVLGLAECSLAQDRYRVLVRMNLRVTVHFVGVPDAPSYWEGHRLYARGGYLTETLVQRNAQGLNNSFLRGAPGPVFLTELRRVLNVNRIGVQKSCWTDRDPRFAGEEEVVWNGRGGRENRFVVTFAREPVAGLPKCSAETENILNALDFYEELTQERGESIVYSD
ncbi:MAG: hypothetical protein ABJC13_01370 [Acidobacteriota bacterium]